MSTRACYSFKDKFETLHVYKHHDGYPSGAEQWIRNALPLAWKLPRFEASDFGAAFVAANKKGDGGVYLMQSGSIKDVAPGDINYRYEIEAKDGAIVVTAFKTAYWNDRVDEQLWSGPLDDMQAWIKADTAA